MVLPGSGGIASLLYQKERARPARFSEVFCGAVGDWSMMQMLPLASRGGAGATRHWGDHEQTI